MCLAILYTTVFFFLMNISIISHFYGTFYIVRHILEFCTNFKGISIFFIRCRVRCLWFVFRLVCSCTPSVSVVRIFYDPPRSVLYSVLPTRLFPPTPISIINFNTPSRCLIMWPYHLVNSMGSHRIFSIPKNVFRRYSS